MIKSKQDYLAYRVADRTVDGGLRTVLFGDIRRFKIILRKAEYYINCCPGLFGQSLGLYFRFRLSRYGRKLGFSIPINVLGPGVSLPHRGTLVINPNARIGRNCRIHVCVNIGASGGLKGAPVIGEGVYIAPGAKIFGDITIADGIAIGANAVVKDSFLERNITIAGVPAKKIGDGGATAAGWTPSVGES